MSLTVHSYGSMIPRHPPHDLMCAIVEPGNEATTCFFLSLVNITMYIILLLDTCMQFCIMSFSNKMVAMHSQDSIHTCKPHTVLAVHCNYCTCSVWVVYGNLCLYVVPY